MEDERSPVPPRVSPAPAAAWGTCPASWRACWDWWSGSGCLVHWRPGSPWTCWAPRCVRHKHAGRQTLQVSEKEREKNKWKNERTKERKKERKKEETKESIYLTSSGSGWLHKFMDAIRRRWFQGLKLCKMHSTSVFQTIIQIILKLQQRKCILCLRKIYIYTYTSWQVQHWPASSLPLQVYGGKASHIQSKLVQCFLNIYNFLHCR